MASWGVGRGGIRPLAVAAMALALASMPGFGAGSAGAQAALLLPNLVALQASELRTEVQGAETYLRFTTTSWNNGAGPLELRAVRDTGSGQVKVVQRVYKSGGGSEDFGAGFFDYHPDHGHIHFNNYARYELVPAGSADAIRVGTKISFCIIDTTRINTRLPGASKKAVYRTCNAELQGMSVGWGDQYRYYLDGQALTTTGLTGQYELRITIDPLDRLEEQNESDNVSSRTITLVNGRLQ